MIRTDRRKKRHRAKVKPVPCPTPQKAAYPNFITAWNRIDAAPFVTAMYRCQCGAYHLTSKKGGRKWR